MVKPAAPTVDTESLEERCRQVEARVHILERQVHNLEKQVIDPEAALHARPSTITAVASERRLKKAIEHTRAGLQQRQRTLSELLEDKRVKLAAVVDSSADEYYTELYQRRAASSAKAVSAPEVEAQRLRAQQSTLRRTISLRKQEAARLTQEIGREEAQCVRWNEQKAALLGNKAVV
uniref:Uncharacterized protein n=1 Tax=Calcidiscus leptoporus TaxID=127549 RepID=A0A7S0J8W2_9EUKA|mmetsp:Transcript_45032/g.105201  ORF Transcript_45032/g.105201 Transcript_45032/m.105201 type:complete len:178 (+) Transcript_45032:225-758(+)|eukprot:CAMPEP_0119353286 /NCGR_PEP_ID=MMETSP1334-20130426/2483_1 /TAXON_ID=127549 /ORGANISM="Calcidiscus leptoporus, Strain RCC1130" /LENGTH=177 /DNA_ID=CAMNT_0007366541 /DNA_START=220 /DNA_END=753 /DNA_ORIENTATION=+